MPRQVRCPINPKTKEKFECQDCLIKDACVQDMCDDYGELVVKEAAKLGRKIAKLLKERGGI